MYLLLLKGLLTLFKRFLTCFFVKENECSFVENYYGLGFWGVDVAPGAVFLPPLLLQGYRRLSCHFPK